jgi:hypothetical protein
MMPCGVITLALLHRLHRSPPFSHRDNHQDAESNEKTDEHVVSSHGHPPRSHTTRTFRRRRSTLRTGTRCRLNRSSLQ